MTPQTEQQLINALHQITVQLATIAQKLDILQSLNSHVSQVASKTGR